MVAMAGESYLLKTRQQPLQPLCQGYHMNRASKSTSCCVVLTLVVLVAAVTAMAGLGYCIAVEQRALRGRLEVLSVSLQLLKTQVNGLHELLQRMTFETELPEESSYIDESDESDDEGDPNDPYYPDDEDGHLIEHKASAGDRWVEAPLQPLHPAGGSALEPLQQAAQSEAVQDGAAQVEALQAEAVQDGAADGVAQEAVRKRREVGSGRAGNARLRLYHTLQTPGVAPQPQADPWADQRAAYSAYRAPMYAEHAPTDFVTPPHAPHALQATTAAPITSRRSRVMDGKHHRPKKVGGNRQRQRLQQHSPLPHEVAQDVAQRSVEVRHGQQHGLEQQQQGAWRGPWRGVRVTDTYHHARVR